jgi:hypothetical protein
LHAATSLARLLWRDRGKWNEARDLPRAGLRLVSEGFDATNLKEAKELLDELA